MNASMFKQIVMPYYQKMYAVAMAMVRNNDDAKDIVQEAVTRLWEKRHEFANIENTQAYCITTTRHIAIDYIRSRHISDEITDNEMRLSSERNTEQIVESADNLSRVIDLMDRLTPQQRQVLELRCYNGCSMEEIASSTGLTPVNVRSILSRARQRLKELYNRL